MSLPLKWSVKDCASTLYACGFHLDEGDMLSNKPNNKKKDLKEKKDKTKVPARLDDAKRPSIADDKDFIVFRFKEDGGIDLVEENSPPRNQDGLIEGKHHGHKASKKIVFDGSSEGLEFKVSEDGVMIPDNEGEEKGSTSRKKLSRSAVEGDGDDIEVITEIEESTELKTLSESTRSNSSASSFAFPVINIEMMGSPERMPKYNEQTKMEKILRFPCCKF